MTRSSLIACVHLSALPIVAHHPSVQPNHANGDAPDSVYVVHRGRGSRARLLFCDASARRLGIRPGQTLSAARGRSARLQSSPFDPKRLAHQQERLTRRLLAFSPRITTEDPQRLWLEPVARTPEALERWCRHTHAALHDCPPVAIGVAPTATVAWAAARTLSQGHCIVPPEHAGAFLDGAPIEMLDIEGEALDILLSLGVRRVHQLRALDPISLGIRFGPAVAEARRRAEGWDPRGPRKPRLRDTPEVSRQLEEEVTHAEALLFVLAPAARALIKTLCARELGALGIVLELFSGAGAPPLVEVARIEVNTANPLTDGRALLDMLRTRLERIVLRRPISSFRLRITRTSAASPSSGNLFTHAPLPNPATREAAIDRLRHRLGGSAVRRASHQESPLQLDRAAWCVERAPRRGQALPWRRVSPPVHLKHGRAHIAGRLRKVRHMGRTERLTAPWWTSEPPHVELLAWAELEGPLLVLLHGRCSLHEGDRWEIVAWVD